MPGKVTKDMIAAYVDGALPPQEAAEVAAAIAADPDALAEEARLRRLNALLTAAFAAPMSEGVPPAIAAALAGAAAPQPGEAEGARVIPFPAARIRAAWRPAALAASVAAAVALGLGWLATGGDRAPALAVGPVAAASTLHAALETQPSGTRGPGGIEVVATFRDGTGRACREFEQPIDAVRALAVGLACRAAEGRWQVEAVAAVPVAGGDPGGYVPAAGPALDGITAVLEAFGAGPALGAEEERRLIGAEWKG